jgi:peptidoglycan/LPS O-acetylase OafA/YrhL
VALVMATHFHLGAPDGQIGVDVFFVLSGFLITTLLLKEHEHTNRIALPQFWRRRALRLFPALGCAIAFALALALLATPAVRHQTLDGLPFVLLYVGNFDKAFGGPQTLGLLVHTWSLAVEEQFYLLWPLVGVAWCRSTHRRSMALLISAASAADAIYFVAAVHHWGAPRAIFASDTHCFGLLAGAALALWLSRAGAITRPQGRSVARWEVCGLLSSIIIVAVAVTNPVAVSMLLATMSATALVASMVLTEGRLARVYSWGPLVWIGRRSYGIYLYHFPISVIFGQWHVAGAERLTGCVACIGISVALAAASYRWVESPFLRRQRPLPLPRDALRRSGLANYTISGNADPDSGVATATPGRV